MIMKLKPSRNKNARKIEYKNGVGEHKKQTDFAFDYFLFVHT